MTKFVECRESSSLNLTDVSAVVEEFDRMHVGFSAGPSTAESRISSQGVRRPPRGAPASSEYSAKSRPPPDLLWTSFRKVGHMYALESIRSDVEEML